MTVTYSNCHLEIKCASEGTKNGEKQSLHFTALHLFDTNFMDSVQNVITYLYSAARAGFQFLLLQFPNSNDCPGIPGVFLLPLQPVNLVHVPRADLEIPELHVLLDMLRVGALREDGEPLGHRPLQQDLGGALSVDQRQLRDHWVREERTHLNRSA